jgi:ribonuclease HI
MDLVHRVKCTAAEYLTCFRKETGGVRSSNEKWKAPSQGIIKFNTDGAFVEGNLFGGWGVIARSEDGEVVAARAGKSDDIHDAFTAELRAMEEAFNLAAELGVIRVEFETDAQLLAMALNNPMPDFSSESSIIQDLKIQSRTWFSSCAVRYSKRATNTAAHELAQHGLNCDVNSTLSWEYEVPECARIAVMGDSAQIVS